MKRRLNIFISLILSAFLIFSNVKADGINTNKIPDPKLMGNIFTDQVAENAPGEWYTGGSLSSQDDKTKPPVVFVHGIHGSATDWWGNTRYYGTNDMYRLAYENGYRVAFVQLYDKKRGASDQRVNGQILTQIIEKIFHYYGDQKITLVTHSKGGVDAQAGIAYNNAGRFLNKVITIASPHHGSHLADLAHSWYAGWLADILSLQDQGTFSLQTANMAEFRKEIDQNPNIKKVPHYTVSGTTWGPVPSALWLGGSYLSQYGENDGVVNEESTRLPYGKHLAVLEADHDLIRKGSVIFPVIESLLRTADSTGGSTESMRLRDEELPSTEQYVVGGELLPNQCVEKEIAVDDSVTDVALNVMTKSSDVDVAFISPSGKKYTKSHPSFHSSRATDIFEHTAMQSCQIVDPEQGLWKIRLLSAQKDAYLFTSMYGGIPTYSVEVPYRSLQNQVPLEVTLHDPQNYDAKTMKMSMKIIESSHHDVQTKSHEERLLPTLGAKGLYSGKIQGMTKSGLYNITIEITGKTIMGVPYNRSIIRSIYVGNACEI